MKIFIDTANLEDIEEALKRGFVRGITTNPSILAKEPKAKFEEHIGKIVELIKKYQPGISLSVEVFSRDPKEILLQANNFINTFKYKELAVKVQVGWSELEVIRQLAQVGVAVNCTCCMTINQAVMAAAAGARYVSLFWGRIRDGGEKPEHLETRLKLREERSLEDKDFDPSYVVSETRKIFDQQYPGVEIIAGSMRGAVDVKNAALAGAHIVTVSPKLFPQMVNHFKTDEVVQQFLTDFEKWLT